MTKGTNGGIANGHEGHVGAVAIDTRLFVEAILYGYRGGEPWRDLLEQFGAGIMTCLRY